tara:strand:- start:1432 stop:2565 length:1134 start_codon:yes stop_codon:yes gene_type:complete
MEKFNNSLKQLLSVIKKKFPEQTDDIDSYYNFENEQGKYYEEFLENCLKFGNEISSKDEIIFSKGNVLLKNINFYEIWNHEEMDEDERDNIWNFLHTLYIYAYEAKKDSNFKILIKELKSKKGELDEESKTFINIIDSLSNQLKNEKMHENESDNVTENGDFKIDESLFGGEIGNLAKEIAEDLNPSDLNLEDPGALLKSLMSGNFDEQNDNSGVVNLVRNITDKLQDKLMNGDLNQDILFGEAQNVMKQFSGGNSSNPMNMFNMMMNSGMMNNLDENTSNIVNQANNMVNNNSGNVNPNNLKNQVKLNSQKDKLRKKLEMKKKLLAEKEKELEVEKNKVQVTEEEIDLDALADEIMNMETKESIKKKKSKKKSRKR